MSHRITIDIGGTFTDAISVNSGGDLTITKSFSTPDDLTIGVMNCIDDLAKSKNVDREVFLKDANAIVHGTTQGFNTILMRSGPKMGVIGTAGHTDSVQLRAVIKENMWDWRMPFPKTLVPRYLWTGVDERITATGEVLKPLNEKSVHKAVSYLKKMEVKSIVVALIFSFLRPEHEKKIGEIIKADYPEADVTLSHDVLHVAGEYERFSTAIIDAYIRPAIADYIRSLKGQLEKDGFKGQLYFMQNNGGIETEEVVMQRPGTLIVPGPAAGPAAAMAIGKPYNKDNLLSADMGGTSFDIAIIESGTLKFKDESLACDHRFSLPVVDIETLGAGGGSTAWFDVGEVLHVGPKGVGVNPGPACYGRDGEEATFTDAALILGYISPDYLLGFEAEKSLELAEKAIKSKVADRLGISVPEAAHAIYKLFNLVMANGISHAFINKGLNPREFVYCGGGTAGPICALRIAKELGMSQVIIPKTAPVYSSFGMLNVDLQHTFSRYYYVSQDDLDLEHVKDLYKEMEDQGVQLLEKENVSEGQRVFHRNLRMRYYGQFHDIEVSLPDEDISKKTVSKVITSFHKKHKDLYGYSDENFPVEFISFGLEAIGKMTRVTLNKENGGDVDSTSAIKGERDVYFEESNGYHKTKVYDGSKLREGNTVEGPCIIEEKMTTIVIPPGFKINVDSYGNYFARK